MFGVAQEQEVDEVDHHGIRLQPLTGPKAADSPQRRQSRGQVVSRNILQLPGLLLQVREPRSRHSMLIAFDELC